MAHAAVTIIPEQDSKGDIPQDYLETAILNNSSCCGAAVAYKEGDKPMVVSSNTGMVDVNSLVETLKGFTSPETQVMIHLGQHPEGFPTDEIQPYTLIKDADGENVVVACIDGEFPGFDKNDAYSTAYHFAVDFLSKKVYDTYMSVGGDMSLLKQMLLSKKFKDECLSNASPRGSISILTCTGELITLNKNDDFGDFSTFWCSNSFDWNEDEEEEEDDKEEPKAPSGLPLKTVTAPTVPSRKQPTTTPQPSSPPPPPPPAPTAQPAAAGSEEKVMMRCPANITKWADVRKWYQEHAGFIPGNFKQRPEVPVSKAKLVQPISTVSQPPRATSTMLPPTPQDVKPATLPIAKTEPIVTGTTASDYFNIIPPEEMKKYHEQFAIRDDIKGLVDAHGKQIMSDPAKIQSSERRWSTFCEVTKIPDLINVVNWSDPAVWLLIKEHPRFAFKLVRDLLRAYATEYLAKHPTTEEAPPKTEERVVPSRKKKQG